MNELEARRKAYMKQVEEEVKKFEEDANRFRQEERERKRQEERDWSDNLAKRLLNDYNIGCKEIAVMIVDRAWDQGHSYGYNEVTRKAEDIAAFIEKVIIIDRSDN